MPSLETLQQKSHRTAVIYGPSGGGKTSLAATIPGRTKYFDFDQKLASALGLLKSKYPEQISKIDFEEYPLKDTGPLKRPFQVFSADLNKFAEQISNYDNAVFDSLTTMAYMLLEDEMIQRPGNAARDQMGGVKIPNIKDYQVAIGYMKYLLARIISLPVNVIFIAHNMQDKDESTGIITNTLAIYGKDLPNWIPKTFEEVYYMRTKIDPKTKKLSRWIQTAEVNRHIARSQIFDIPIDICVDNGWKDLEKYWNN